MSVQPVALTEEDARRLTERIRTVSTARAPKGYPMLPVCQLPGWTTDCVSVDIGTQLHATVHFVNGSDRVIVEPAEDPAHRIYVAGHGFLPDGPEADALIAEAARIIVAALFPALDEVREALVVQP